MKRLAALLLAVFVALPAWAQIPLALSTASQAVKFGPFVDSTDGNTEKTALTINNTDVHLSKNGGTIAAKNSGGCTHDANGWYTCTFDATDTNTAGRLTAYIHVTGALPVFREFTVGPVAVNTTQVGGTTQTARDLGASVLLSPGTGTGQVSLTSGAVTVGTNNDKTGYSVSTVSSGAISEASYATTAGSMWPLQIVDQGTAQAATATTLQLRSADTFGDSELVGATACITGGSAAVGECRIISAYTGATDTATVPDWNATPSGTITYKIYGTAPGTGGSVSISAGGISASSFASGAIDSNALASNAITSAKIATGAITSSTLANGAITEASYANTGTFGPLGIIDMGQAQSVTASTIVLRSAAGFANDEIIGATVVITGGSTGVGQARTVSAYASSTKTATLDSSWTTTPTGTVTYAVFGTALGASGSLTAADVWTYGTRELTALSQARTTLALNSTAVGSVVADEPGVTTLLSRVGTPAGASLSADVAAVKSVLPTALVGGKMDSHVNDLADNSITAASINADAITAAKIAADADTEIGASVNTAQGVITGVCSSGSTTTCVDAALTQAAAEQLQDRLVCFDDNWCALVTTFTPASHQLTTTKTAPSTRASKAYAIYPATAQ